jgi:hypothetical protein
MCVALFVKIAMIGEGSMQLKRKRTSRAKVTQNYAEVNETLNFDLQKQQLDNLTVRVIVQQYSGYFPFRKRVEAAQLDFNSSDSSDADSLQHWHDMIACRDSKTPRWHTMIVSSTADRTDKKDVIIK